MFRNDNIYQFHTGSVLVPEITSISRSSSEYIKWVQSSLNKILNLNLVVDGISGTYTKSAIRSFQSRNKLTVDGIVGPITEGALLRAGASPPPGSPTTPSPSYPSPMPPAPAKGSLRSKLVATALQEWNKWGQGSVNEASSSIQPTLRDYWITGTGSDYGYTNNFYWSAAFISWVVKKAGGGTNFKYSGTHTTYTYAAKQNRLQNNSNPFKAYRISEKKPEPGDIIVQNRGSSSFTYDNVQSDQPGTHGDIVVQVNSGSIYVIGGNLSNSVSRSTYYLDSNGYLNSPAHFAIIKIEERKQATFHEEELGYELLPEYETSMPPAGSSRKSRDYIKWVQQSLNQILGLALLVDGISGTKTKSAIRSFQTKQGLTVDGIVGPNTEQAINRALATSSSTTPITGSNTTSIGGAPGSRLGKIVVNIDARNTFSYQFTASDLEWTMKFFEGETGGRISAESAAVFWAMVNRFGIKMSLSPNIWRDFTDFLRQYSTTLQPVLHNKMAAYRHRNNPDFVFIGNDYYPINNNPAGENVRKGQLRRHLTIQAKTINSYSPQMIAFAQSCLTGTTQNPGIGLASEFGNTGTYFRDRNSSLCAQRKAQGQPCPSVAEWENFNRTSAGSGKQWVGNITGLRQYDINTFFLNTALIGNRTISVSIT